jgi:hypothetical protein
MMAPPRAVALDVGTALMGAALAVNLAVIGLVEMPAVAPWRGRWRGRPD